MPQITPLKTVTAPLHCHIEQLFADIANNPFFFLHNPSEVLDLDLVKYNKTSKKFENRDTIMLSTSETPKAQTYYPSTPAGQLLYHFALSSKSHPHDLVTQQIINTLGVHKTNTSSIDPPNTDHILCDLPLKDQIAFVLDLKLAK
jgi:hypothetical protein